MGGGLMQLVAYGAQDIYLTGNPQITFFKIVYRRHTNFAMEAIEQVFSGEVDFGKKTSCTIARNGDLIGRMYLEADITHDLGGDGLQFYHHFGHKMIDFVEIEIGGQTIDKQYGQWMDIWSELSSSTEKFTKLSRMIINRYQQHDFLPVTYPQNNNSNELEKNIKLYVPLQFWFNTNPGLALPLISLQYHEVKLNLKLHSWNSLLDITLSGGSPPKPTISNFCLFCDYIFLDTDERRRFAQVSHEYLIHQIQYNGNTSVQGDITDINIPLRFNHPVKEIIWVVQNKKKGFSNQDHEWPLTNVYQNWEGSTLSSTTILEQVLKGVIQLNGHDRFKPREGSYFSVVQPFQHHTGDTSNLWKNSTTGKGYIYCYSFAIKPEEHQPSGTCNFSRIDNAVLYLSLSDSSVYIPVPITFPPVSLKNPRSIKVWAINYNVLRIMSGMGGLAYSN